jgi:hypothetical protein
MTTFLLVKWGFDETIIPKKGGHYFFTQKSRESQETRVVQLNKKVV